VQASSDTASIATTVTLPADVDLHARPAAEFVRTAMRFNASIWLAVGDREVDAKSLLSILALGAKAGTTLKLRAAGDDASDAVASLTGTVSSLHE
jgi:phosphocarrier protein HPr